MSVGPPGGKGMTSLMGLDGYLSWARTARAAVPELASALAPISSVRLSMASSRWSPVWAVNSAMKNGGHRCPPSFVFSPYGRMVIEKPGVLS
jgi:hypothetical protein